jgi:hypothetical protein
VAVYAFEGFGGVTAEQLSRRRNVQGWSDEPIRAKRNRGGLADGALL